MNICYNTNFFQNFFLRYSLNENEWETPMKSYLQFSVRYFSKESERGTPMNLHFYRILNFSDFSRYKTITICNFSNFFSIENDQGTPMKWTIISVKFFQTCLLERKRPRNNPVYEWQPCIRFYFYLNFSMSILGKRKSRSAPMNGRVYPSTRLRLPHRPHGRALSCKRSHQPDSYPDVDKFPRRV